MPAITVLLQYHRSQVAGMARSYAVRRFCCPGGVILLFASCLVRLALLQPGALTRII